MNAGVPRRGPLRKRDVNTFFPSGWTKPTGWIATHDRILTSGSVLSRADRRASGEETERVEHRNIN